MKKTLLLMAAIAMLAQTSIAAPCDAAKVNKCNVPCQKCKQYDVPKCECDKPKCETPCEKKASEDQIEKDNKCFFDNQFAQMKKVLCLSPQQDQAVNCIYDRYKNQMQILHDQAAARQAKLCKLINECADNSCIKEQKEELKEIRNEAKEQYKCFVNEVKEQLCKDQEKCFNKFNRQEKKKMKKLAKYCMTPKFPCNCGCNTGCGCGCN